MKVLPGLLLTAALGLTAVRGATPVPTAPLAPAELPGRGLAEHPFFYAGEWNHPNPDQTMYIVRDGHVVWSHSIKLHTPAGGIQEFSDATLLPDGRVLFAHMSGATLVDAEHRTLWHYDAPPGTEVHVAQPLPDNQAMIVRNGNPARMFIFDLGRNTVVREMILPTNRPDKTHGQFRRARLTAAGTLLAAHMDWDKVVEYDSAGREVWSCAVPSPWAAVRLPDGHTLITSNRGFVREVDARGDTVWEFSQADVPEIRLFGLQEANRLANGNTVISNWCPNSLKDPQLWRDSVQVLEVTRDKRVVWALRAWDEPANLGPATNIQLLDQPEGQIR